MTFTGTVNLSLVQMRCSSSPEENVRRALAKIDKAVDAGAQIICLQEVFNTHYPCQSEDHRNFDFAEPIPGPTSLKLSEAAKKHGVVIACSIFERRAAGLYHNTALVFDVDGRQIGKYRKMHIPDDPLYYEKFYFTPGDLGFTIAQSRFGCLGVGVCWDQWFPEAARIFAIQGAQILLYPTAIGWLPDEKEEFGPTQHDAWCTSMRAHAIANGLFVGAANRTGREGELEFWGRSFIAGPNGQMLAEAGESEEEIVTGKCDLGLIDTVRTHWPFLRDRRIDAYEPITQRYID